MPGRKNKGKNYKSLFVVTTAEHFVGAFTKPNLVKELGSKYIGLKFLVQAFPLVQDKECANVWLVQQEDRTTLYASNDKATAERYQRAFTAVGRVCEDDLDYWCYPLNVVQKTADAELKKSVTTPHPADLERNAAALKEMIEFMKSQQEQLSGMFEDAPDGAPNDDAPDEGFNLMKYTVDATTMSASSATAAAVCGMQDAMAEQKAMERAMEQAAEFGAEQDAEFGAERDAERDAEQDTKQDTKLVVEQDAERDAEFDAERDAEQKQEQSSPRNEPNDGTSA
jgi:hypothetical protein